MLVVPALTLPLAAQDNLAALRDISKTQVDQRLLRTAVASRTLTWLTGSSSNNDYMSVGRMANFFGFVGLRVASNHSLTRSKVAQDTMAVLDKAQLDRLVALVSDQKPAFERATEARYRMNRALEGLLVGETIPEADFLALGRAYGAAEAELGRVIGQRLGEIAQSLTPGQKSALQQIRAASISGHSDEIGRNPVRIRLTQEDKQELVNVAARLLSWTTGSPEFNDFEVVGKPSQHFGFVSLRIESNHGVRRGEVANEVWNLLTRHQQKVLDAAARDEAARFGSFLEARARLMRTLEVALTGETIDPQAVERLGSEVGEIEARMTWAQALAMLEVRRSLTEAQMADLLAIRARYTVAGQDTLPADPGRARPPALRPMRALPHQR